MAGDRKSTEIMTTKGPTFASPYYLHPSDNPGSLISPVQLKGDNYEEWARSMQNALRAKKKLGFIEGNLTKPDDESSEIENWWMVNSMLAAWILNTIEQTLHSTVTYTKTVKDLWDDIRHRFSIINRARIHQLKTDLAACKQRGQPVVQYYGKLKIMWDDLVHYEPIPICTCGGCTCKVTATLEKKREDERVHQFLMGLDDGVYGTVCSSILSLDPLPNLNRVYAMIVQEERHHTIAWTRDKRAKAVGFSTQVGTKGAAVRAKKKLGTCGHCGRTGHEATKCFQVIGYPDWWVDRPKENGRGHNKGRGGGTNGRG